MGARHAAATAALLVALASASQPPGGWPGYNNYPPPPQQEQPPQQWGGYQQYGSEPQYGSEAVEPASEATADDADDAVEADVVAEPANETAVTEADVDDESEYNDIKEDMCALPCRGFRFDGMANWIQHADGKPRLCKNRMEECSKFGKVEVRLNVGTTFIEMVVLRLLFVCRRLRCLGWGRARPRSTSSSTASPRRRKATRTCTDGLSRPGAKASVWQSSNRYSA